MNKKFISILTLGILALLVTAGLTSAYHYDNYNYRPDYGNYYNDGYYNQRNNYYDSYSYTASRNYGYDGMPAYSKSVQYDKYNSYGYLPDGTYQTQMHYMKTTRESPYYRGYSYPRSNYYYNNYPQYNYYPMNYGYSPMHSNQGHY